MERILERRERKENKGVEYRFRAVSSALRGETR